MPINTDYGVYSSPSSYVSSLYLPYSNHSSIVASNFRPPSYSKLTARPFSRGYKPHLQTISESQSISPLRKHYGTSLLLQSSPKVIIPRPIKINTADIDVSFNKYRKFDRTNNRLQKSSDPISIENRDLQRVSSPLKSPSPSKTSSPTRSNPTKSPSPSKSPSPAKTLDPSEDNEELILHPIRRERALVRLRTIHKKDSPKRNWRQNFVPSELNTEDKKTRKSPGELLKDKFLIKNGTEEEGNKNEDKTSLTQKRSPKTYKRTNSKTKDKNSNTGYTKEKSPSFHDICSSITQDEMDQDLNPGQPIEIQRKQSRQFSEDFFQDVQRKSAEVHEDNVQLLDEILKTENLSNAPENCASLTKKSEDHRASVKRKKKLLKKKSNEQLQLSDNEETSAAPLQRRHTKRYKRTSTDGSVVSNKSDLDLEQEQAYQDAIRDISQVEVEEIKMKPKPLITATVDVDPPKPSFKVVVDDVEIVESPKAKKKFKFNVTVEEIEERRKSPVKNIDSSQKTQSKEINNNEVNSLIPRDDTLKTEIYNKSDKSNNVKKDKIKNKKLLENGMTQTPNVKTALVSNIQNRVNKGQLGQILELREDTVDIAQKKKQFSKPKTLHSPLDQKTTDEHQTVVKNDDKQCKDIAIPEIKKIKQLQKDQANIEIRKTNSDKALNKEKLEVMKTNSAPDVDKKVNAIKKVEEPKFRLIGKYGKAKTTQLQSKPIVNNSDNESKSRTSEKGYSKISKQSEDTENAQVKHIVEKNKEKKPTAEDKISKKDLIENEVIENKQYLEEIITPKGQNANEGFVQKLAPKEQNASVENFWAQLGKCGSTSDIHKNRNVFLKQDRTMGSSEEENVRLINSDIILQITAETGDMSSKLLESNLENKAIKFANTDLETSKIKDNVDSKDKKGDTTILTMKAEKLINKNETTLDEKHVILETKADKKSILLDKKDKAEKGDKKVTILIDPQKSALKLPNDISVETKIIDAVDSNSRLDEIKENTCGQKVAENQISNSASKDEKQSSENFWSTLGKSESSCSVSNLKNDQEASAAKAKTDQKLNAKNNVVKGKKTEVKTKIDFALKPAKSKADNLVQNHKIEEKVNTKEKHIVKVEDKVNVEDKGVETKEELKGDDRSHEINRKEGGLSSKTEIESTENLWAKIGPRESLFIPFTEKNIQNCEALAKIAESNIRNNIHFTQAQKDDLIKKVQDNRQSLKIENDGKEETVLMKGRIISKRSLILKSGKVVDPDLEVFFPPPEPDPVPEPEPEKTSGFVPLQSNRLSGFMIPFKKPEQFEECPVEIYATPKVIRGRHYPRPRHPPPQPVQTSSDESDETDETSEEDSEDNVVSGKVGASTSSNDSGFDSSAPSHRNKECDVNCHKKCEKLTANLCGVNQKMIVEAIQSVKKSGSGSSETRDSPTSNPAHNPAFAVDPFDEEYQLSSTYTGFQKSGRITPPATTIPRFRKYTIDDFHFLKVLGKGSFGKVLLAELKDTEYYYAIKCLKKDVVLEDDDVECTLIERKVLALGTKHPYLCHLLCTFQTESHLFFVMEYLNGGDLMFHIQASGRFPEPRARFYGAEIVSGLKFLHSKGIVYRDLKLDNILLDFDGHVRIADFGMCKLQIFLDRTADTFCGTPDYMAPEIIKGLHYNQCVDWWSFGVLLYEMLIGQSPFSGCDEDELFWSICNEKPVFPRFLTREANSILILLLEKDGNKRLGNKNCPAGDIQDQPFFKPIEWDRLEDRLLDAPFKPRLAHPLDTQYFDKTFTLERAKLTPIDKNILQSMDQTQFQGFSYTNPNATDR